MCANPFSKPKLPELAKPQLPTLVEPPPPPPPIKEPEKTVKKKDGKVWDKFGLTIKRRTQESLSGPMTGMVASGLTMTK